jgi:hypothetical protein
MKKISSKLPEGSPGLSRSDRVLCLASIHVYIRNHNLKALEFFSLIEKESFAELLFRVSLMLSGKTVLDEFFHLLSWDRHAVFRE